MKPNKGKKTLVMDGIPGIMSPFNLSAFGELSFDAVMIFDSQRQITYWNRAAEHMYGWTAQEALGKTMDALFWPTGTSEEKADLQNHQARVERGEVVQSEYFMCRKDGSRLWVEFVSRAIADEAGRVQGYIAIHRSQMERRRMEDEIHFVAKLPNENPNPVLRLSADGQLVYANPASQSLLNYWKQETGQSIPKELQKDIQDSLETRSIKVVEIEYEGKTLSCTLAPIHEMGYVNFYGNDVTEHRQISRELQRTNAESRDQVSEMRTLLDILPIGVWIGNHDCSVITGNPAAYQMIGLNPGINASVTHPDPETPPGLRILVEGREVEPKDAPMQTVARTGKPLFDLEQEILFEDGTRKTVLANIVPVFDRQGLVRKVIGTYTDLTERKQGAERLARLQQVTAALSEAVTPEQVARVIINRGIPVAHATGGTLFSLTEDGFALEILYSSMPETVTHPYQYFPLSREVPSAHALRFETPIWISSQHEYIQRYPYLKNEIEEWGLEAAAAIPLIVNRVRLGVLTLSFKQARRFTAEDKDFILTLAQQCAQTLERAKLHQKLLRSLAELEATYNQSPIGMIQLDGNLRYRRVNETLAKMNGIPVAEHIGKTIQEIVPDLTPALEEGLRRVLETGEPQHGIEIVGETKAEPGVPHTWLEVWYPWRNQSGDVTGVNIAVQDITNRKRDELALAEFARQQAALFELADELHRTQSMQDMFDAALQAILQALSCDRASILLFDEAGVMRFVAWHGLSDSYRQATEGHSPWKPDEKNAAPIAYDEIPGADFSDTLKLVIQAEGIGALAFIPLVFEEKLIGKFMVYFNAPHPFTENDLELSQTIAHQIAFGVQRKRAENALRDSEERLRLATESARMYSWELDLRTKKYTVSHNLQQVMGFSPELFPAGGLEELLRMSPLEDVQLVTDALAKAMQERSDLHSLQYRVIHPESGQVIWLEVNAKMILDATGKPERMFGVAQNISGRKRREEQRLAEEEELDAIINRTPFMLTRCSSDLHYRFVSDAYARMIGRTREEVINKPIVEIMGEEGLNTIMPYIEQVLQGRRVEYETKVSFEGVGAPTLHVIYVPDYDERGDVMGWFASIVDMTERKQAENALWQSEKRFGSFMQHLPGLAWIKDMQGRYIYANGAAQKAFNIPQERLYGATDKDIFPPEVAVQYRRNDEKALLDEKGVQVVEELLQNDGILHYSLVNKFPIPGPDGKIALIGGTAFDITERKQAEVTLQTRALQQRTVATLGELAIREHDLQKVLDRSAKAVAETLGVEYCEVLDLLPGSTHMLLRAGAGWRAGLVGNATVSAGMDSQAGFTLISDVPIIVYDLPTETRFNSSPLLIEHAVLSGMSCIIRGSGGVPWGVIGAYSTKHVSFTLEDINFLVSIANILGDIIQREQFEQALHESQKQLKEFNETLEQKVQAQTAEIRKLASDLTKAEQRERNRVARILHDDLQQRLYAIQIQVSTLSDQYGNEIEKQQQNLARIRKQIQEAVLITRHLSIDLSPPILRDEGLSQAVEWVASQMKKRYGLEVDLQADESFANPDEDLRVLVFNCIRELLFNIVKHAGRSKAQVVMQRVKNDLRIQVRDEGKGFNIAELPQQTLNVLDDDEPYTQSFGLSTIHHQLSLFGGHMTVESEPGRGTLVTITIPYP